MNCITDDIAESCGKRLTASFKTIELSKRKLRKLSKTLARRHHAAHGRIRRFFSLHAAGLSALFNGNAGIDIQKIVGNLERRAEVFTVWREAPVGLNVESGC